MSQVEASEYEMPFEYVKKNVLSSREKNEIEQSTVNIGGIFDRAADQK